MTTNTITISITNTIHDINTTKIMPWRKHLEWVGEAPRRPKARSRRAYRSTDKMFSTQYTECSPQHPVYWKNAPRASLNTGTGLGILMCRIYREYLLSLIHI